MKGIIYKATNTLSGMVYIGQTSSGLSVRRTQHLQDAKSDYRVNYFHFHLHQCPEAFEWEVLDEFRGTDAEVAHALNVAEEYWILKYDATNPDKGYNSTAGGYSSNVFADHVRKRLNRQQGAKAVLQYDLEGNFVKEFPSISSVAAEFDMPKLKNRDVFKSSWHGFMWKIKEGGNFPRKIEPYNPDDGFIRKVKVAKYDYNGDLVCIYPSLSEARACNPYCSEYKRSESLSIREQYSDRVILMKYGNARDEDIRKAVEVVIIEKREEKSKMPNYVSQFDLNGVFVRSFESAAEARRCIGVDKETVRRCCKISDPYILTPTTKYVFRRGLYKEGDRISIVKPKRPVKPHIYVPKYKVLQYSLGGKFIKAHTNISKASADTGESYGLIRKMCLGGVVQSKMKYQWRYYTENYPMNIEEYREKALQPRVCKGDKVGQYTLDGDFIKTHRSISDASRASGDSYALIRKMCLGGTLTKQTKYQWRYYSEDTPSGIGKCKQIFKHISVRKNEKQNTTGILQMF